MNLKPLVNILLCGLPILSGGCINEDEPEMRSLVAVGDRLPDFEVVLADGSTVSTESLAGRQSVVVLFTTTCQDCRDYLPHVEALHRSRPDLPIVCIPREGDEATINAYWADNGFTMQYSPEPRRDVYNMFATAGVPRTYVSDATLTVIAVDTLEF